ncbi:MAG: hypothetical protein P8I93_03070 [Crocinitomicaceae bacterium]|nr:hypothetical protein [Crocinitomicaceae bacterium]
MLNKTFERLIYLSLIINIFIVKLFISVLTKIIQILPIKPQKDLGVFLHSPKYSDGYYRRFEYYFKSFDKDGIKYDIFCHYEEGYIKKRLNNSRVNHYILYHQILWKRFFQVLQAKKYKSVIIQRCLFPLYPDYKTPFFEKNLRKLNKNIILDIWDPIHIWSPKLTYSTFNFVDKVSVNVSELKDVYKEYFNPNQIYIWPISINPELYMPKTHFELNNPIKLFYTGNPGNVKMYLKPIIPILEKLNEKIPIELNVISSSAPVSKKININHYKWDNEVLKKLISECDYGIYPNFNDEKNFTVAGKVLDYMTTGLPIIGAGYGLPKKIDIERSIFKLNKLEDWEGKLENILQSNIVERKQKAEYAREFVLNDLSIENGYLEIIKLIKT